jgi:hypothetical protein
VCATNDDGRRRTTTDDDGRRRTTTDDDGRVCVVQNVVGVVVFGERTRGRADARGAFGTDEGRRGRCRGD